MPEATFWFSNPFRDWIGQRTVTVRWDGCLTLRGVLHLLAAEHPSFRLHVFGNDVNQDTFNNLAAVLMDGNFLALDSVIPDQATVEVLTPLAGGAVRRAAASGNALHRSLARHLLCDPRLDATPTRCTWRSAADADPEKNAHGPGPGGPPGMAE